MNKAPTEAPESNAYRIIGIDGGMIGAMVEAAAISAAENPAGYLETSRIILIASIPGPAASVTALPLIPEKMTLTRIVTWPWPPRNRPMIASEAAHSLSLIVAAFMTLAARMNIGTANST